MRRDLIAVVVTAGLTFASAGAAAPYKEPAPPPVLDLLRPAAEAFIEKDCAKAGPLADQIIARADFPLLNDEFALRAIAIAADCALAQGRTRDAWAVVRRSTAYQPDNAELWRWRLALAVDAKETEDAAVALEGLARTAPETAAGLDDRTVFRLYAALADAGRDAPLLRLLGALEASGWAPKDPLRGVSHVWLHHARLLAERGDLDAAARVLPRVSEPHDLAQARLDGRFAPLLAKRPELFDVRAAAERRLAARRADLEANPRRLDAVQEVSWSLAVLGRPDEAMALLDQTTAKLEAEPDAFDLADGVEGWFRRERATTLSQLGRFDEALAETARAAADGQDPYLVEHHAERLLYRDRPAEALAVLDRLDRMTLTPYLQAWATAYRACAYARLGRSDEARALYDELARREGANPRAAMVGFLCVDDLDRAADVVERMLADPKHRGSALLHLSDFRRPPAVPPLAELLEDRTRRLRDRADVRAAVRKAGRTERFDILL